MLEDNIPNAPERDEKSEKKGHPLLIIALAVVLLFVLSLMPWSKWTGGAISDFNLLSDIFPTLSTDTTAVRHSTADIDPELATLTANMEAGNTVESSGDSAFTDTTARVTVAAVSPRKNGEMVIEDYTPDHSGLTHLKAAIARSGHRPVRIGVIGDSYIEGDILTQDIRRILQEEYGGHGVGYVPAFSETAGFRRSVIHKAAGWTESDIRKSKKKKFGISGQYFTGEEGATFTFSGTSKLPLLSDWAVSKVLFIAPVSGSITLSNDREESTFEIHAAPDSVQCLELQGRTTKFKLTSTIPGIILLGAWLEDGNGVVLDNMSLRGDSGMSHTRVSAELTAQMRRYVDYDLIILEYGINALSEEQTEYSAYSTIMTRVARHLKACYPNADILLLGIGDRGVKKGGVVTSIPTATAMVTAQREAARKAGVLFWDTREAMGREGAIVQWRDEKLVNGDYIHLNAAGGKRLAEVLVKSIKKTLGE